MCWRDNGEGGRMEKRFENITLGYYFETALHNIGNTNSSKLGAT